jgi:uncharacterized protein (DUF1330 family)
MAAYIIATVNITDPVKFSAYSKAIAGLSEKHGGEYIVRGKITQVLEGNIDPDERVVVSRFPSEKAALAYAGIRSRRGFEDRSRDSGHAPVNRPDLNLPDGCYPTGGHRLLVALDS